MPQNNKKHGHFTFSYHAYCKTCEEYVGPERPSIQESENDAEIHKKKRFNKLHNVKIQVTQS